MKPTFSIVIPTLNEERFLPRLLTSLVAQDDTDFEIIIADGSSKDKTVAIAKRFEKKLPSITILTDVERGVANQRNIGSAAAKGDWIVSTDADTIFHPYFISRAKAFIKKEKPVNFTSWFSPEANNSNDAMLILFINVGVELTVRMKRPGGYGALLITRRDVFQKVGGYDETKQFGEDNDICRRIYEHGHMLKIVREPLASYSLRRYHKHGTVKTFQTVAWATFIFMITKKSPSQIPGYEMGGQVYTKEEEKKRFTLLEKYEKTLRTFIKEFSQPIS